ncbi:MAG: DUF1385 domain-containing protein [Lachnospiraceae bacterium]
MKYSGIGGQAVMEGIMMKNNDQYAVAVRKSDQEIIVDVNDYQGIIKNKKLRKIPIVRGVINFLESMILGMKALTYSASFFEDEDSEDKKKENSEKKKQGKLSENVLMGITVGFSIVLAIGIFMLLPYGVSLLFQTFTDSHLVIVIFEGLLRLAIFIGYVALISLMPDIKRVYMYHGAEHKCINCIEHGHALTIENVKNSSKEHKRCGTSFLILVILISIVFFMFIRVDEPALRLLLRVLLVPIIAGVSYEFIRLAGRSDNSIVNLISRPGILLQKITTREPDDDMIEVGIASVEAVFDWKAYLEEIK